VRRIRSKHMEDDTMAENTSVKVHEGGGALPKKEETRTGEWFLRPAVDIYETEKGLTVVADLPGVDAEGLTVRVEDSVLTLEGRPAARTPERAWHQEFQLLRFFRQFELPEEVDQGKISAELKNGVLRLELPKAERAKPRRIQVKVD